MILDKIVAHKKESLVRRKSVVPLVGLEKRAAETPSPRGFGRALRQPERVSLIAEIKKASPSAGVIRDDINPPDVARIYEAAGASAISVLTDEAFFAGSLADLKSARGAVGIPVIRKDFILDAWQVFEARAAGADAILLIVAILADDVLGDLLALCRRLGMDALVETHTAEELERAAGAGANIIGINNRDLKTFHIDLATTIDLMPQMPRGAISVSESGIHTRQDVQRLQEAGVDAVLVGTALMKADDPGAKIRELMGR